tara:strand:- start:17 stop:550 length:534 start_codon:yes stop_codon:yes gene_type:complete
MATFNLLPETQSGTNEWSISAGTNYVNVINEDDDSTYIYETRRQQEINYTTVNPAIAEAGMDFTENVTVTPYVHAHHTGTGTVNLDIQLLGVGISLSATTKAISNDSSFPAYAGTATTNKSIGTSWDYSGLQAINLKLECQTNLARFQSLRVSYAYIKVDYTAVVATSNSVFFGANF